MIQWGDSQQYDNGNVARVALYGNTAVEVHGSDTPDELRYRVGTVSPGSRRSIPWGDSHPHDKGETRSVAFYSDTVVEVNERLNPDRSLWYRVGFLPPGSAIISWGDSYHYDDGNIPSVALYGNTAVKVHADSGSLPATLRYRVGLASREAKTIAGATVTHMIADTSHRWPSTVISALPLS